MLTLAQENGFAVINIDTVRLNKARMDAIVKACKSNMGAMVGAFFETYNHSAVVFMHGGKADQHQKFKEHLASLM